MKPLTIQRALREATDEQIKSEWARRTSAMRKTKTGGHNGGRPKGKKTEEPETSLVAPSTPAEPEAG